MNTLHLTPMRRAWHYTLCALCALIFGFLVAPIIVIIPLSFSAERYFTFTQKMLTLAPAGFSLRWYADFFGSSEWNLAVGNSFVIAICSTIVATVLGTLAALGLSRSAMPMRTLVMSILISPMIVPIIISGAGMYFFYSSVNLVNTLPGIVLAHATLGAPFVVITVTATLIGFDHTLTRASANLGARPLTTRLGPLDIRSVVAAVTLEDRVLAVPGGDHELMRPIAADWPALRLDRNVLQPAPRKDAAVGIVHRLVRFVQLLQRGTEAVGVLHQEFAGPQNAEARAFLVPELRLDLIERDRELAVAVDVLGHEVGDDFLVRGAESHVDLAIATRDMDVHQHVAECLDPSSAFVEVNRREGRHLDFDPARAVHLLADNVRRLVQRPQPERQIRVCPGHHLANQPRPQHQAVARHLGVRGVFLHGWDE